MVHLVYRIINSIHTIFIIIDSNRNYFKEIVATNTEFIFDIIHEKN